MGKTPKLRFPGFTGEWEEKKLGDVANLFDYGMNTAATEFDGINKYIRITDIDEISNTYNYLNVVSPLGELDNKYKVNENDILFARTGASVGKSYLYNKSDGILYFAGFLIRINVNKNNNSKFIFLQTLRDKYNKWIKIMSMRSGQPGINANEYKSYKIYSTNVGEQEKIATFFSVLDKKIEKQQEKVELLKQYKKGMMQKIFNREIRFKDENGEDYPEWVEKKLGEVSEIIMGQSPSSQYYNENQVGIPLIQGNSDIKNKKTSPRIYTTQITKTCDIGDIVMSVRAPVGQIAKSIHNACIGRGICGIKANQNDEFMYQFLLKQESKWGNMVQGSTFESINKNDITNIVFSYPSIQEQQKIANFLSTLDKKIEKEQEKLNKLNELKKGLLQQMFV